MFRNNTKNKDKIAKYAYVIERKKSDVKTSCRQRDIKDINRSKSHKDIDKDKETDVKISVNL